MQRLNTLSRLPSWCHWMLLGPALPFPLQQVLVLTMLGTYC